MKVVSKITSFMDRPMKEEMGIDLKEHMIMELDRKVDSGGILRVVNIFMKEHSIVKVNFMEKVLFHII